VTDTVCFCRSVPVAMNDDDVDDVDDDGREKKYEVPGNPFIFESDRLREYRFINAGSMADLKQANRKVLAPCCRRLSLPIETGPQHRCCKRRQLDVHYKDGDLQRSCKWLHRSTKRRSIKLIGYHNPLRPLSHRMGICKSERRHGTSFWN
jgi:hypothetical protein